MIATLTIFLGEVKGASSLCPSSQVYSRSPDAAAVNAAFAQPTPLSVQRSDDRMESRCRGVRTNPNPEMLGTFSIIDGNDADGFRITALIERVFLIIHHVQRFIDRLRER